MGRMVEISKVTAELPTSYRTQRFSRLVIFCDCSIGTTFCNEISVLSSIAHKCKKDSPDLAKSMWIHVYDTMERRRAQARPLTLSVECGTVSLKKKRKGWKDASFFLLNEPNCTARRLTASLCPVAGNDPSRPPFYHTGEQSACPPAGGRGCFAHRWPREPSCGLFLCKGGLPLGIDPDRTSVVFLPVQLRPHL